MNIFGKIFGDRENQPARKQQSTGVPKLNEVADEMQQTLRKQFEDDLLERREKLKDALLRQQQREFSLPYPPRVFIAYKGGNDAHNSWVRKLAAGIEARGLEVVYDQGIEVVGVEEFVARIAECSIFLPVITSDYLKHSVDGLHMTWVHDELNVALLRQQSGMIEFMPVLREIPMSETLTGIPGEPLDMTDDEQFDNVLDQHFKYAGPRLSPLDRDDVTKTMKDAFMLKKSGKSTDAMQLFQRVTKQFPFVRDVWIQQVMICMEEGDLEQALFLSMQGSSCVLAQDKPYVLSTYTVLILEEMKIYDDALHRAAQLLRDCSLGRGQEVLYLIHFSMGDILDKLEEFVGARNHLTAACAISNDIDVLNCLGVVYEHLGCWEKALNIFYDLRSHYPEFEHGHINAVDTLFLSGRTTECKKMCEKILKKTQQERVRVHVEKIMKKLELKSTNSGTWPARTVVDKLSRIPPPWFTCKNCGAVFPINTRENSICGDCGAIVCKEETICRYCTNDGRVPIEHLDILPVACPICRNGTIVASNNTEL